MRFSQGLALIKKKKKKRRCSTIKPINTVNENLSKRSLEIRKFIRLSKSKKREKKRVLRLESGGGGGSEECL